MRVPMDKPCLHAPGRLGGFPAYFPGSVHPPFLGNMLMAKCLPLAHLALAHLPMGLMGMFVTA